MQLDIRDIAIINSLPILYKRNDILTVGCGECRLEIALQELGYKVTATDIFEDKDCSVPYKYLDILDTDNITDKAGIVICSQVLEHIKDWTTAVVNLMNIATERIIITVPVEYSFYSNEHVNFWSDMPDDKTTHVNNFRMAAYPFSTSIGHIITKIADRSVQLAYLIIIDKTQKLR